MESIIWLIVGAVVGIAAGFVINKFVAKSTAQRAADEAHTVVEDAKRQAETLRREAVVDKIGNLTAVTGTAKFERLPPERPSGPDGCASDL